VPGNRHPYRDQYFSGNEYYEPRPPEFDSFGVKTSVFGERLNPSSTVSV